MFQTLDSYSITRFYFFWKGVNEKFASAPSNLLFQCVSSKVNHSQQSSDMRMPGRKNSDSTFTTESKASLFSYLKKA